jgi:hypothetical protein
VGIGVQDQGLKFDETDLYIYIHSYVDVGCRE